MAGVVAHGQIVFPDPEGAPVEHRQYARGVATLRHLVPSAFTSHDPTPDRDLVFCLFVHDLTGRAAMSGDTAHE
ncbi:MAG: hypothetical protein IPP90_21200 [Gemmatimonadaceae bacterium]|nr:hypothetical protein [Gemmatimonadaceae bacterium]